MNETDSLNRQRQDVINIFRDAMRIYSERDEKYKGLWSEYGAEDILNHIMSKSRRTRRVFRDLTPMLVQGELVDPAVRKKMVEDGLDAMVYIAFFIYCVDNGLYFDPDDDGDDELEDL